MICVRWSAFSSERMPRVSERTAIQVPPGSVSRRVSVWRSTPRMPLPPFANLLDAHGPAVHRFLLARAGSQEADDLFQETFLSALRAYPALRDDANLEGWLMTIAHRKTLDLHRARARAPVPAGDRAEAGTEDDVALDDGLWRRVGDLPPRQRMAVALRFACDLTYADIARVDGGTEAAARRNVHVALKTLRRELAA